MPWWLHEELRLEHRSTLLAVSWNNAVEREGGTARPAADPAGKTPPISPDGPAVRPYHRLSEQVELSSL